MMAVRLEPSSLAPGATARVDVLVTDSSAEPRLARPDEVEVSVPAAASDFAGLVRANADGWTVTAPDAATLATLRTATGLAPDALVLAPLELTIRLPEGPLFATKVVALGAHADNPPPPVILVDGVAGRTLMPFRDELQLSVASPVAEHTYRWFSSIGDLAGYTRPEATLEPLDRSRGTVAVVVRDHAGGTAWSIERVELTR
ncbi:MAG: hypothetical protein SFX73_13360 [Kofleriaceae bacterium]|nr:hypothetical protein [Kofleriaceae bacterium]